MYGFTKIQYDLKRSPSLPEFQDRKRHLLLTGSTSVASLMNRLSQYSVGRDGRSNKIGIGSRGDEDDSKCSYLLLDIL